MQKIENVNIYLQFKIDKHLEKDEVKKVSTTSSTLNFWHGLTRLPFLLLFDLPLKEIKVKITLYTYFNGII